MYISKNTIGIIIFITIYVLILTFKSIPQVALVEDGSAYLISSTWWGLKKDSREVKLINNEWCAKSDKGEWYPLMFD